MKKIITIFCIACLSVSAIAQSAVRIGNYEFFVRNTKQDSLTKVFVEEDPCPPCPSENETRPKPKTYRRYNQSNTFGSIGLIVPDNGSSYYKILDGNSINLELGGLRTYHLGNWFALGGTLQYSYYNYRFKDINEEPDFYSKILDGKPFEKDFKKQVFRSHNVALSAFTRFYLLPLRYNGDRRLYLDLGAQGDYAVFRHYMEKKKKKDKDYYKNTDAFNPFNVSAIARIGGIKILGSNTAFFARYRFTEAFNQKELPMDLPPLTIGIQFF
jgi:hypothetical protein